MVEVDAAVGHLGDRPLGVSSDRASHVKTSAIRRALARLMVIMTKTMESIIRLISTLMHIAEQGGQLAGGQVRLPR